MLQHYRMFADYNRWANTRLYAATAELDETQFRQSKGAFFGSLQATLNHILAADRIWMKRITGTGEAPGTLDVILFDDLESLTAARDAEDRRIVAFLDTLSENALTATFTYRPISNPVEITQPLGPVLAHLFNHQTHHRGQCHMTLTALGRPSLVLDLIAFLRSADGSPHAR